MDVITYPCWDKSLIMLEKEATGHYSHGIDLIHFGAQHHIMMDISKHGNDNLSPRIS